MTFADPVESLNAKSTALRDYENEAPRHMRPAMQEAADEIDTLQRQVDDCAAAQREVRGMLKDWAAQLEATTQVRIGQMDSASRAQEKNDGARNQVLDVVRKMRAL